MKAEPVNCLYEHVFSQPLLYYCISQSFYKVPGELFKIIIIIIIKKMSAYFPRIYKPSFLPVFENKISVY